MSTGPLTRPFLFVVIVLAAAVVERRREPQADWDAASATPLGDF